MPVLIANDNKSKFIVPDAFISKYGRLKALSSTSHNIYPLSLSSEVLEAITSPHKIKTIHDIDILNNIIKGLDFLDADDSVWLQWIDKLPRDYDTLLPLKLVEKIWSIPNAEVPQSYYNNDEEVWKDLIKLVSTTIDTRVREIYIAYLIMLRLRENGLTIREYEGIVDTKVPRLDHFTITVSDTTMFTYATKKHRDTDIFIGYPEIFALLTTADNNFMPKNIFTYNPDELGMETFIALISNYKARGERDIITSHHPFTVISRTYREDNPSINAEMPNPYPILQRLLRVWTIGYLENPDSPPMISEIPIEWTYGIDNSPLSLSELANSYFIDLLEEYEYKNEEIFNIIVDFIASEDKEGLLEYIRGLDVEPIVGKANANFFHSYINVVNLFDMLEIYIMARKYS